MNRFNNFKDKTGQEWSFQIEELYGIIIINFIKV